jgi:hypothetical protein
MLSTSEFFTPKKVCREGLAGPLTETGFTIDEMCNSIENNPAAQLIFFGLAKYHALFCLISIYAARTDSSNI